MPGPNDRTQVHRHPERGTDDPETVRRILDDALTCTVAWVDADGRPRALPTIHARIADILYLHGSRAARAWKTAAAGAELCVVATVIRRARPRAHVTAPLDELPQRRRLRHRARGHRVRRAVRGGTRHHPARAAGPGGRRGRAGRRRLARDVDRGDAHGRGEREGPHRPADRRPRRPRARRVGRHASPAHDHRDPIPAPTSDPGSSRPRTSTDTGVRDRVAPAGRRGRPRRRRPGVRRCARASTR